MLLRTASHGSVSAQETLRGLNHGPGKIPCRFQQAGKSEAEAVEKKRLGRRLPKGVRNGPIQGAAERHRKKPGKGYPTNVTPYVAWRLETLKPSQMASLAILKNIFCFLPTGLPLVTTTCSSLRHPATATLGPNTGLPFGRWLCF